MYSFLFTFFVDICPVFNVSITFLRLLTLRFYVSYVCITSLLLKVSSSLFILWTSRMCRKILFISGVERRKFNTNLHILCFVLTSMALYPGGRTSSVFYTYNTWISIMFVKKSVKMHSFALQLSVKYVLIASFLNFLYINYTPKENFN